MRTATSKTFLQPDGSFRTTVSAEPVHYQDEAGKWRDIRSDLIDSRKQGFRWRNEENRFQVDFRDASEGGFVSFDSGRGAAFTLALEGAASVAGDKKGRNELSYEEVLPGVSLAYAVLPTGLKESLVLEQAGVPSAYRFTLHVTEGASRLSAKASDDGSVGFYLDEDTGVPVFTIAAPVVSESVEVEKNGAKGGSDPSAPKELVPGGAPPAAGKASLGVERTAEDEFGVTVRLDPDWLNAPERVFPVVVDPTVSAQPDVQDGYYNTSAGSNLPVLDPELYVGPYGGTTYAAALTYDLTTIPQGAQVVDAKIGLNFTSCFGTCPTTPTKHTDLTLTRLTSAWTSSTPWSAITKEGGSSATAGFDMGTGARQLGDWQYLESATLASKIEDMASGALPNYGFLLEGAVNGVKFGSSRYTDVGRTPRLYLEWVANGVRLDQATSVHSNGADLSWQHYSGGLGPYPQAVLADAPVSYWRLDDAPGYTAFNIADWSGSGNHGNLPSGSVTWLEPGATADGDQSMYFDGSTGKVIITDSAIMDSVGDTFAAEAWIKRGVTGVTQTIMSRGGTSGLRIQINSSNKLILAKGSGGSQIVASSTTIADTLWHHIAVTKNGGTVNLYIDGIDRTGSISPATLVGDGDLTIGANGSSAWFNGWIDEVAIWPDPLTAADVQAHYAAGALAIPGFDRYEVHRSTTAGFTPSASTLVRTIKDPSVQSYRDTTAKPSTTFYYKVVTGTSGGTYTSNEIAAALPAPGQAQVTFQPGVSAGNGKATTITSSNPCANQGAVSTLTVGATSRALVEFDVRSIPSDANVSSAKLSLFTSSTGTGTINVHRVTGAWKEGSAFTPACDSSGATWNQRVPSVNWTTAGGDYDPSGIGPDTPIGGGPGWDEWTVTSLVQGWLNGSNANLGFLLRHGTEPGAASIVYAADGYTNSFALRPKLVVDYTESSAANAPQVAIGAPVSSSQVKGTVTVTAGASDDGRVANVQFKVDGGDLGSAVTSPPYQVAWDTSGLPHGTTHALTAIATDDAGNTTTSSAVNVTAANSTAPTTSVTGATPAGASWTVSADASDDFSVSKVEFYVDGDRFGTDSSAPYQATLDTLAFPTYDGAHTLTTKAYDGDGNTATSAGSPITVTNTAGTQYQASISTGSFIPAELRYDPAGGTQESAPITVGLTNNSSQAWAASSIKLRYRWLNPDGTEFSNSGDVSIGADLGAGNSRNVDLTIEPPALPASLMRGRFALRLDLYDTGSGGGYFAAKGNKPLERFVTVTRVQSDELGVEPYQQYDREDLGGGVHEAVNLANGDSVVQWSPLSQPGLGPDTNVTMTHNSLETGSVSPLGNNWSLAISGVTSFGLPLDIHPNAADTAAGRTAKWVAYADATGSYHRFDGNSGGSYYTAPAGVHLYLKMDSGAPADKRWQLVEPDRTTYYFDDQGYPTRVQDADGNALVFTLDSIAAGEDAYGLAKRITTITDAGGRTFTLAYYTKAETAMPALRGKLKSLTDHVGHKLTFAYYDDGNLLRISEEGGTNADGSYLADRSLVFTYTNPAGTGPAIATLEERRNPDPTVAEGKKLFSVIDFRGNETTFAYSTSGPTDGRLTGRTNRTGDQTTFSYDIAARTATVTKPLQRAWTFTFDTLGRPTTIDDPVNPLDTTKQWTADNQLQKVTQPTGFFVQYAYNDNGDLTSKTDELGKQTTYTYESFGVDGNDTSSNWETGRTIGHISRLMQTVEPVGNATPSNPTDYTTTYAYVDNSEDHIATVTDALGNVTTNSWNADGTLASTTLPANGDGLTRTTTYDSYDANGLATQVTDAAGGITRSGYLPNGQLASTQDANHASFTGTDETNYRTENYYDSYGRLGRSSQPKSTASWPGLLIWDDTVYDANDNVVTELNAHYGFGDTGVAPQTTTAYDAMDRATLATGPRVALDGGPVQTQTEYDAAGRVIRETEPNGVKTVPSGSAWTKDFVTETTYDKLDRVASTSFYAVDANGNLDASQTRTSNSCYDLAGDLRTSTAPKGAASFTGCPAITTGTYTPYAGSYTTRYDYDAAHRQTKTTDPLGNATQTAYDENGAVTSTTNENNKTTTFTYSDRGEKIKQVEPFDTGRTLTTKWEYDPLDNLKRLISPRAYDVGGANGPYVDYVESYSYDKLNRLVKTSLPKDASTPQAYVHAAFDANGNQTMVSLPATQSDPAQLQASEKTVTSYWDTGSILSSTDPANPTVHFDYTAEGWQASRIPDQSGFPGTLDLGKAMYWDYLPDGLKKAERDLGGERVRYSYDADGNQIEAKEADGITDSSQTPLTVQESFDGFDELVKTRTPKPGVSGTWLATRYSYDLNGNQTQLTDNAEENDGGSQTAEGRVQTYTYNGADRVTTQTDNYGTSGSNADDEKLTYSYTATGWLAGRGLSKYPFDLSLEQSSEYTYYDNGTLKQLTNYGAGNLEPPLIEQHTLSYISGTTYLNGNRVSDVFKLVGPNTSCKTSTCTASWIYDARERLKQEINGTGQTTTFTLDAIGNVTTEATTGQSMITRGFDGQRLATVVQGTTNNRYIYDSPGSVDCIVKNTWTGTACPTEGNAALLTDYIYDYKNRLAASRIYNGSGALTDYADYVNDPLDRPIKEAEKHPSTLTTSQFSYLGDTDQVSKEVLTGGTNTTKKYSYDALGQRATIANGASRYSYLNDPHSSVSLLIDQTNNVKASYGYSAYGSANSTLTKLATGYTEINSYRYTGKRTDGGSKTLDLGSRRYEASLERFLQRDLYYDGPDDLDLASDATSANRYVFTGANPINRVDPDGHRAVDPGGDAGCDPSNWGTCVSGGGGGAGSDGGKNGHPHGGGGGQGPHQQGGGGGGPHEVGGGSGGGGCGINTPETSFQSLCASPDSPTTAQLETTCVGSPRLDFLKRSHLVILTATLICAPFPVDYAEVYGCINVGYLVGWRYQYCSNIRTYYELSFNVFSYQHRCVPGLWRYQGFVIMYGIFQGNLGSDVGRTNKRWSRC